MTKAKKLQIQALLDGAGKAGPELTHGLSVFGDGKMADGLTGLWKAGQHNGVVKGATLTTLTFAAAIGGYILVKNAIEEQQIKKLLAETQTPEVIPSTDCKQEAPAEAIQETALEKSTENEG